MPISSVIKSIILVGKAVCSTWSFYNAGPNLQSPNMDSWGCKVGEGGAVGKQWEQLEEITEHNYCLRMATSGKQLRVGFKTALMKNGTLCREGQGWEVGEWKEMGGGALLPNLVGMKRQQRKQQAGYKTKSREKRVLTREGHQQDAGTLGRDLLSSFFIQRLVVYTKPAIFA